MEILNVAAVRFCYSHNQELIRQGRANEIEGRLETYTTIATQSGRRVLQQIAETGATSRYEDPNEYDKQTIYEILDGKDFNEDDYKAFAPILVLYDPAQIAAVCIDLIVTQWYQVEVISLYPFRAKWHVIL